MGGLWALEWVWHIRETNLRCVYADHKLSQCVTAHLLLWTAVHVVAKGARERAKTTTIYSRRIENLQLCPIITIIICLFILSNVISFFVTIVDIRNFC